MLVVSTITTLFDLCNVEIKYSGWYPHVEVISVRCIDTNNNISELINLMEQQLGLAIWEPLTDHCNEEQRIFEGIQ